MSTPPIYQAKVDSLPVNVYKNNEEMGRAAAAKAATVIQKAIAQKGSANIIIATGNSQLSFLSALAVQERHRLVEGFGLPHGRVCGLPPGHSASFPDLSARTFSEAGEIGRLLSGHGQDGRTGVGLRRLCQTAACSTRPICALWASAKTDTSPSTIRPSPSFRIRCW